MQLVLTNDAYVRGIPGLGTGVGVLTDLGPLLCMHSSHTASRIY